LAELDHHESDGLGGERDAVKYRELVRMLEQDGWLLERVAGSHMQYRHPTKPGTVTVPGGGKLARDVPPGTLSSVLKQAQLKRV
jgi:predicted RNA binding protein YcfA (HicA-like mRNA interferase family)